MRTVNIHAAKTHLSRLVEAAAAGEEIIIAKAGKPLARLVPLPSRSAANSALSMVKSTSPRTLTAYTRRKSDSYLKKVEYAFCSTRMF